MDTKEIAGITVEMPYEVIGDYNVGSKAERIKSLYEAYIKDAKPDEKVRFLETTILNRGARKRSKLLSKNGISKNFAAIKLNFFIFFYCNFIYS